MEVWFKVHNKLAVNLNNHKLESTVRETASGRTFRWPMLKPSKPKCMKPLF